MFHFVSPAINIVVLDYPIVSILRTATFSYVEVFGSFAPVPTFALEANNAQLQILIHAYHHCLGTSKPKKAMYRRAFPFRAFVSPGAVSGIICAIVALVISQ